MNSLRKRVAAELLQRMEASESLLGYITYTKPKYKVTQLARIVCPALDRFILDVQAGVRPILVLQAPPQHGKSEIVSRKLPAYLMGRFPDWRIGAASYSDELANAMAQDVRRNLADGEHQRLWPDPLVKRKFDISRMGEFSNPRGEGSYIGGGIGSGFTGRPLDIGIVDDPTKDQKEALSPTTKENHWNWFQSVLLTRMSERSGIIIMATSWAEDDLPGRIIAQYKGNPRFTHLRMPAINLPGEVGYNSRYEKGALCPELHSLAKLRETKADMSDYWWAAIYQQSPKALGGNVFKESGIQYYFPHDLPKKFDKVICSWDCTFKDTDGTDFVVGQVWGKLGANSYLLDQMRDRMSFTTTCKNVVELRNRWPNARAVLVEDKANGPAVIDVLKKLVPGLTPIAVQANESKLSRAHAVTSYWEAKNIFIPHISVAPWIKDWVGEITIFDAGANDDQVDAMTQALRYLYPLVGRLNISQAAIDAAMGITTHA